ncbi:LacI family DNA-binding transcriptional regulator [Amycolatopsis sp. NPDC058278]|jgi:LacI family transcriptional regulator|uniref:LacI family DNA-binding transcriptional regulator n=1 Tax=unclassified Amycolatopsis TaxID=2618356 RepID=UPI00255B9E81|nr:LacI family DNA-binding transcriptional regulator [Amycolatopsis sp. DG1A-15b]WIX91083.1 LacI family DNA-binding transcriptional regulator [Amycolatopsis sp. DG1A-15b]
MQPSSRVTIRDVAARAGVSVATVSKVINERYGVSAATLARVRAVIEELGYEASLVAQSLRNHRTNVIGILVADLEPFSTELLKGAADAIRGSGFELVVYSAGGRTGDPVGWEKRYLSRLSGTLVDGAVLVTPAVSLEAVPGTPVVAVDPHTGPSHLPTIDSDNLRGAQLATEHLLELGHRRIAFLSGRPDLQSAELRKTGYLRALTAAGITPDEDLIRIGAYDPEVSAASAHALLTGPDRPTAVFAANDISAIATVGAARELGLAVPDDLSVVGFDNVPESALCSPPLTTVDQPIREMGHRAIRMLIALINGDEVERTHVTLATGLVVRHSTRALP